MYSTELDLAIVAHVRGCADCRRVQLVFQQVDETLQRDPLWDPPEAFAARIAARAPGLIGSQTQRIQAPLTGALTLAAGVVLVAVVGYLLVVSPGQAAEGTLVTNQAVAAIDAYARAVGELAQDLVASSVQLTWASAALSLALGMWFTRRALA